MAVEIRVNLVEHFLRPREMLSRRNEKPPGQGEPAALCGMAKCILDVVEWRNADTWQ